MRVPGRSRRNFLKVSAGAGGAAMVGGLLPVRITSLPVAFSQPLTVHSSDDKVTMRFPRQRGSVEKLSDRQAGKGNMRSKRRLGSADDCCRIGTTSV